MEKQLFRSTYLVFNWNCPVISADIELLSIHGISVNALRMLTFSQNPFVYMPGSSG